MEKRDNRARPAGRRPGGVLAFVFARIFVEPVIERAIGYEEESAPPRGNRGGHGARARCRRRFEGSPGRAGQHRHGTRGAGVQRRHGCTVRRGVRRGLRPRRNMSARLLSVYVAGGMLLSLYVVPPEVSGQPAGRKPRRDDPAAHAVVPADGGAVGRVARGAVNLGRDSLERLGAWNATLVAAGPTSWRSLVMLVLPTIDETPGPLLDDAGNIVYGRFSRRRPL